MNQPRDCTDLIEDRADFRGHGDQASAAKRAYSAWAALRFSALTFGAHLHHRSGKIKSPTALRTRQGQYDPSWGAFSEADDETVVERAYTCLTHRLCPDIAAMLPFRRGRPAPVSGFDIRDNWPRSRQGRTFTTVVIPPCGRHFLSSACGHNQALALTSRRAGLTGHNFNCAAGVVGLL